MVFLVKLFFSVASFCVIVAYAARQRPRGPAWPATVLAAAAGWGGVLLLAVGHLGLDLPLRPAYWVLRATGDAHAAAAALGVHIGGAVLALVLLTVRLLLMRIRHPGAEGLEVPALSLWLIVWIAAMFGWV